MSLRLCTTLFGEQKWLPKEQFVVRPSAYAVIVRNEAVLLVTNAASGRFYLPGGGVEVGESLQEAVVREVREEAGIDSTVTRLLAAAEDFFYHDPTGVAYHGLLFYYHATTTTNQLLRTNPGDDDEGNPQWIALQTLQPHQFHNHGERLYQLIQALR